VGAVCALVVAWEVIGYREHRVRVRHPELAAWETAVAAPSPAQ
jgi:hypothetical protein